MGLASEAGTTDPGAMGDGVVPTGAASPKQEDPAYVEYKVDIPYKGRWCLWGRMKYKNTSSNSFFAEIAGKPETRQRFGNTYVWGEWLWDSGVMFRLDRGPATIRILAREAVPGASPLLDVLCLTNDPEHVPSDEDAKERLEG